MWKHAPLYLGAALAGPVTLGYLLRVPIRPRWAWAAGAGVFALFLVYLLCFFQLSGEDVGIFRSAGCALWRGDDPYADERLLNPPTAWPLFAVFALLPAHLLKVTWMAVNVAGVAALVLLARRVLTGCGDAEAWELPPGATAVLTALVLLSGAFRHGLALGQLSLLTAVAVLAALDAQCRGRPFWAGAWLALASVKPATMLPFLILFHRRSDRAAWVSFAVVGLVLSCALSSPAALPAHLRHGLANIEALSAPGKVNDVSYRNWNNADMIALDHAFYRLGLRGRTFLRGAQAAVLVALGAWVAWRVLGPKRWPRAAACSLVALFSTLFLYHRLYDTVILALPLVYCTSRAWSEPGRARWPFAACAVTLLTILNVRLGMLVRLTDGVQAESAGRLVEALLLPYGTWLVLLTMGTLELAERWQLGNPQAAAATDEPPGLPGRLAA
jgi:hypothetical protein